jgi:exopolysaccharide biosynthesis operon protein EpsL
MLAAAALGFAHGGVAADVDYRDTLERAVTPLSDLLAPPMDFFDVFVGDAESYDSNLFRLQSNVNDLATVIGPNASRADYINTASVGTEGQWTEGKQMIALNARADDNHYSRNTDLNNVSGSGGLTWNWQFGNHLSGQLGGDFNRSLAGFYNTNVYTKDLVDRSEYFGSGRYQLGPHVTLSAGVLYQDTTLSADAAKANDNRRKIVDVGAEYATSVTTSIGVDYRYTDTTYSQDSFLNGVAFSPDYREDSPRLVLKYAPSEKTEIDAIVGYLKRDYTTNVIGDFRGDVWRVALQWNPTGKTLILLTAYRNLQADFTAETDYFISNTVSLSPTWTPSEKLALSLSLYHEQQDYVGSSLFSTAGVGRRDTITAEQMGVVFTPYYRAADRSFAINGSFRHEQRDSNQAEASYTDNIARLGFLFKF